MKGQSALQIALIKRGGNIRNLSKYLAARLGVTEPTARAKIREPSRLTVGDIRALKLTDEEIRGIVG